MVHWKRSFIVYNLLEGGKLFTPLDKRHDKKGAKLSLSWLFDYFFLGRIKCFELHVFVFFAGKTDIKLDIREPLSLANMTSLIPCSKVIFIHIFEYCNDNDASTAYIVSRRISSTNFYVDVLETLTKWQSVFIWPRKCFLIKFSFCLNLFALTSDKMHFMFQGFVHRRFNTKFMFILNWWKSYVFFKKSHNDLSFSKNYYGMFEIDWNYFDRKFKIRSIRI